MRSIAWLAVVLMGCGGVQATPSSAPEMVVEEGAGRWVELEVTGGARRVALTEHERYCFSPGIGVIASVDSASTDSLLALAERLRDAALPHFDGRRHRYLTLQLVADRPGGGWDESNAYVFAFMRSTRDGRFLLHSFSKPPGAAPPSPR